MTPILSTLLSSSHSKSFAENGVAFVCEWRTVSPLPCSSREIFTAPGKLLVTRFPVFPFSITAPYSKPFLFAESRRTRNVSASTFDRLRGGRKSSKLPSYSIGGFAFPPDCCNSAGNCLGINAALFAALASFGPNSAIFPRSNCSRSPAALLKAWYSSFSRL